MTSQPSWRPMQPGDLSAVIAIADEVHRDFFEAPPVLAEKQALYPDGALVLASGPLIQGYVLSHPWRFGDIPPLNAELGAIPEQADTYYLHDLALLPEARGTGAAAAGVARLMTHAGAAGFARSALVAVNGSTGFWARRGFAVADLPTLAEKLTDYEKAARYMVRPLS